MGYELHFICNFWKYRLLNGEPICSINSNEISVYLLSLHMPAFYCLPLYRYAKEMSEKSFQLLGLIKRVSQLFKRLHEGEVCNKLVNCVFNPTCEGTSNIYQSGKGLGNNEDEPFLIIQYSGVGAQKQRQWLRTLWKGDGKNRGNRK